MSDQKPITPPEEPEFSSRNVRSNVAPIFQILQSEQLILQRTDQKAFTLMSLLAAFMVFFIVHFPKVMDGQQINMIGAVMILIYFLNATFGLINLMLVIVPRIRNDMNHEDLPDINATFFGGIVQCDMVASGVIAAFKNVNLKIPVVVRLEGTNSEKARILVEESGLKERLILANGIRDAAKKAVAITS